MTHAERCRAAVEGHARELAAAVKAGRLNRSALRNLLTGFVDQPAYYHDQRAALVAFGMTAADQVLASEASV